MPTAALPPSARTTSLPPERAPGRRTSWWDPLALILLGLAGGALSYDALRQVAVAVHIRPHLAYLFPLVVDGFIAYGVRALLVLRDAPWPARAYAWTLFGTATAASLWANALHAIRLNQPGAHTVLLGDHTVAILSAIAPLALAGATHMHILIGRHGSARSTAAGTPLIIPAEPTMIPADSLQVPPKDEPTQQPEAVAGTPDRAPRTTADVNGHEETPIPAGDENQGQMADSSSGERAQGGRSGRKPEASIEELADIIRQAHPNSGQVTRAMAREAIESRGLSAGNERIAEALKSLHPGDEARPHPATD